MRGVLEIRKVGSSFAQTSTLIPKAEICLRGGVRYDRLSVAMTRRPVMRDLKFGGRLEIYQLSRAAA
jgi:hypothetical protein